MGQSQADGPKDTTLQFINMKGLLLYNIAVLQHLEVLDSPNLLVTGVTGAWGD